MDRRCGAAPDGPGLPEAVRDPGIATNARLDAVPAAQVTGRDRGQVPLKVQVELVVVDGEAGESLHRHQAAAVLRALRRLPENMPPQATAP